MENRNTVAKPKTRTKKLSKVLLVVVLSLVTLNSVARAIWRFSGSNHWEFLQEKNGVTLYTLKSPGSDLRKFKGIVRVHSTLPRLVKMFQDPGLSLDAGAVAAGTVERVDDQVQYYTFQQKPPFPFHTREYVIRELFNQNPQTKEILVYVTAVPDKIPPDKCCFRVAEMNNTWRFTPVGNGQIEVEWIVNPAEGGFIPDLLLNTVPKQIMMGFLVKMEGFANREKYQNAKFDFIKEPSDVALKSSAVQQPGLP